MKRVSIISFNYSENSEEDEKFKAYFINKYKKACKKIDWAYGIVNVFISINKSEYQEIKVDLHRIRRFIRENFIIDYSKQDLDNAEYLEVFPASQLLDSPSENKPDLFYDEFTPGSETYINQNKDLRIRKGSMGKKEVVKSYERETIISVRLKEEFERENFSGLNLRPVYTASKKDLTAYQIVATNVLPRMAVKTRIYEEMTKIQKQYHFISYNYDSDVLLYYPTDAKDKFKDFNYTEEYFGQGFYPRHLLIISQKVREVFEKNKIKGIEYTPIYFEN